MARLYWLCSSMSSGRYTALLQLSYICCERDKRTPNQDGNVIARGPQAEIGGNDRYASMCRNHFKENYCRQALAARHQLPLDVIED